MLSSFLYGHFIQPRVEATRQAAFVAREYAENAASKVVAAGQQAKAKLVSQLWPEAPLAAETIAQKHTPRKKLHQLQKEVTLIRGEIARNCRAQNIPLPEEHEFLSTLFMTTHWDTAVATIKAKLNGGIVVPGYSAETNRLLDKVIRDKILEEAPQTEQAAGAVHQFR